MANNPIPFNPDTMTVSQVKECAETLSQIFKAVAREDADPENIILIIEAWRDAMAKRWAR